MDLFSILFALFMLALWAGACVLIWALAGAWSGLGFIAFTLALGWMFWGGSGRESKIVRWNGFQPVFEEDDREAQK